MSEAEVFMALAVCALGVFTILVPFLLLHQRKMAEIVHRQSAGADDLSRRLDALTEAVIQLAARLDREQALTAAERSEGRPPPLRDQLSAVPEPRLR